MSPAAGRGARPLAAVCVVVPVHDEQELLGRCIAALRHAVAHEAQRPGGVRTEVVLVLDGCTDGSAAIARLSPFHVVEVSACRVGAARAVGVDVALAAAMAADDGSAVEARTPGLDQVWVASTDADSAVPVHWVSSQVALADAGADVVVGTVRPDPADLSPRQRAAWEATHVPGLANGHVHGANLGMRADVYRAAGGYPPVDEHEDVDLVARARATGARVVASDDAWVLTSGRQQGRTPGGYARFLREDLVDGAQV
ncbi:glycosyl transferase [Sanguibacter keddieii DSM 10542]|uniref:4,4'-diaponeurosporenoate glycosyltransferase n=1 Tax=Sanguibacter keddieii (strain ATCC 51767 / DSM 10542 / NCFB 3025 / ST-74) TaxID=446469 RepID=D1BHL3_SANKS|nr:glycosyltransferase [Sanguibacter keddieii]ACZ21933.1 glycosyl transferase [Sanguibacter keddieii DSM 10542]